MKTNRGDILTLFSFHQQLFGRHVLLPHIHPHILQISMRISCKYPSAYPAKIHLHIHIPATYSRISFKYPSAYPPNIHPQILQISIRIFCRYLSVYPHIHLLLPHIQSCQAIFRVATSARTYISYKKGVKIPRKEVKTNPKMDIAVRIEQLVRTAVGSADGWHQDKKATKAI